MSDSDLEKYKPRSEGDIITDRHQIRWLINNYFKAPKKFVRPRDEEFDGMYCDPEGYVWGIKLPLDGNPSITRYKGYLIGENNLEVKQPIT